MGKRQHDHEYCELLHSSVAADRDGDKGSTMFAFINALAGKGRGMVERASVLCRRQTAIQVIDRALPTADCMRMFDGANQIGPGITDCLLDS